MAKAQHRLEQCAGNGRNAFNGRWPSSSSAAAEDILWAIAHKLPAPPPEDLPEVEAAGGCKIPGWVDSRYRFHCSRQNRRNLGLVNGDAPAPC
jgi:hypothetical protein